MVVCTIVISRLSATGETSSYYNCLSTALMKRSGKLVGDVLLPRAYGFGLSHNNQAYSCWGSWGSPEEADTSPKLKQTNKHS